MAGVLGRFSFDTAAEKQLKQRKHYKKHCFFGCRFGKRTDPTSHFARAIQR